MIQTGKRPPATNQEILDRYPQLTAHLICESLGYFGPTAAANAIRSYAEGRVHACEWYLDMAAQTGKPLLQIGREVIARAFQRRHHHKGYMADYRTALFLVYNQASHGRSPVLQSW